jgi:hypothetical protein
MAHPETQRRVRHMQHIGRQCCGGIRGADGILCHVGSDNNRTLMLARKFTTCMQYFFARRGKRRILANFKK